MKKYEAVGEAFIFLLRSHIPKKNSGEYKSKLIKALEKHTFTPRKENDPLHPKDMRILGKMEKINYDSKDPEKVVEAVIRILDPFYVATTQNKIKKYIEDHL